MSLIFGALMKVVGEMEPSRLGQGYRPEFQSHPHPWMVTEHVHHKRARVQPQTQVQVQVHLRHRIENRVQQLVPGQEMALCWTSWTFSSSPPSSRTFLLPASLQSLPLIGAQAPDCWLLPKQKSRVVHPLTCHMWAPPIFSRIASQI